MMLLAVDIGNTNITLGTYEKEDIPEVFKLSSDRELPIQEYEILLRKLFKNYNIDSCMIGSVVPELDNKIQKAINNVFGIKPVLLVNNMDIGIKLKIKVPEEVGADRIANAYAAGMLYSKPAIVVDLGTAITIDIVDKNGDFAGGIIMPGINLQLSALNKRTSKLPRIDADSVKNAIGKDTKSCILSGVIRGTACAVEGLIRQCEEELGEKAVIIATGGDSNLISEYMTRKFDYVNKDLTLEGLKLLYNRLTRKK